MKLFKQTDTTNRKDFFNFLGELIQFDRKNFNDYGYNLVIPKINKKIQNEQLLELEYQLIEKYILGSQEKILTSFVGRALIQHALFKKARCFVTNKRVIISSGKYKIKMNFFVAGLAAFMVYKSKQKSTFIFINQHLESQNFNHFIGHQSLIENAIKIKNTGKVIVYTTSVPFTIKNEAKQRKFGVKLIPIKNKKESGRDFKVRTSQILTTIEKTLQQSTQSLKN